MKPGRILHLARGLVIIQTNVAQHHVNIHSKKIVRSKTKSNIINCNCRALSPSREINLYVSHLRCVRYNHK